MFIRNHNPKEIRGHKDKLFKPALRKGLNCRKNFSSPGVVNEWNSLPSSAIEAKTVNQFKNSLDAYWKAKNGYGVTKATA